MTKTRKRHLAKAPRLSTEVINSQGAEKLDLLTAFSEDPTTVDSESEGHGKGEPQALRDGPLSERLGTLKQLPEDLSSISSFKWDDFDSIKSGIHLEFPSCPLKELNIGTLDVKTVPLLELDMKFMEWCRNGTVKECLAIWGPQDVDIIVSRTCSEVNVFPRHVIKVLLQHGRISDHRHGLLEKILAVNDLLLLCDYLQQVPDIRESSFVRVLEYVIHDDFPAVDSFFQPLPNCDIREQLLWYIFGREVDLSCLKETLSTLIESDRLHCLRALQRIFAHYLNASASPLGYPKSFKGFRAHLPAKHVACVWLSALIDCLYPSAVFNPEVETVLRALQQDVKDDVRISSRYEQTRGLVSSLVNGQKSRARQLRWQEDAYSKLYVVESVLF